jgi:hypothetical protein
VWHPNGSPDLAEFTRDLASGRAGILTDIHLAEQAERPNVVGVGGMRGKAPTAALGGVGTNASIPDLKRGPTEQQIGDLDPPFKGGGRRADRGQTGSIKQPADMPR